MSQNWPLSQLINKSSGTCSICLATRQIHIRDGTISRHGSRHNPCPGLITHHSRPTAGPADQSASSLSVIHSNSASSVDVTRLTPIWSPADATVIKHIPKSARTSCVSHLAALLCKTLSNPDSTSNWVELFKWGHTVLHAPKPGGKRHNLTSAIKLRIST